ncbi:MAG: response regulator transcription factor [Actinomycetota bacterium]|nr:response regulator transcription factor [Actinomycetota bacterium]
MAAEAQPGGPFVAQLLGPPGLTLEVFRQLVEGVGVVVVDPVDPDDLVEVTADVVVLVQPGAEHWAQVREIGVPLVLVQGQAAADDADVVDSVLAGADAVLHCDSDPDTVLSVIAEVSRGGSVMEPGQMRMVAGLARAAGAQPGVALSRRENEILCSIAEGRSVKQTARDLSIAPKTVENLQGRLFRKLGARNRAQAVARAHGLGLL